MQKTNLQCLLLLVWNLWRPQPLPLTDPENSKRGFLPSQGKLYQSNEYGTTQPIMKHRAKKQSSTRQHRCHLLAGRKVSSRFRRKIDKRPQLRRQALQPFPDQPLLSNPRLLDQRFRELSLTNPLVAQPWRIFWLNGSVRSSRPNPPPDPQRRCLPDHPLRNLLLIRQQSRTRNLGLLALDPLPCKFLLVFYFCKM